MPAIKNLAFLLHRQWRWCALVSVLVGVAGFIVFTDTPRFRYEDYYYQCRMIYGVDSAKGDVDLAVMGSSRSMRAMQADTLARKVEERYGRSPTIYDLSRSYRDMGHMLTFVTDLLNEAKVNMLLVEYKETGNQWRHPYFERTATFAQIAESFSSRPSVPALGRIQEQVRLVLDRLTYRATQFLEGDIARDCAPSKRSKAVTTDPSTPWYVSSELLVSQREKHGQTWRSEAAMVVDIEAKEEERNTFYIRRMIDLARKHDTEIFFYYISTLYSPPLDPAFVARFEETFGAPLLYLLPDDLDRIYPTGFTDATHMGWGGSDLYMTRLAELLPWPQYLSSPAAPER